MEANNVTLAICFIALVAMIALNIIAAAAKVDVSPATIGASVAGVVAVAAALIARKPGS
ncbi:MAG TPA: hypothetical protein VGS80_22145 [Ktedonobacterales bacterium]|nr:hypothetical protein [Ktedonobacterales bacterium]